MKGGSTESSDSGALLKRLHCNGTRECSCDVKVENLFVLVKWAKEAAVLAKELSTTEVNSVFHRDHRKVFPSGQSTGVFIQLPSKWASLHVHAILCNTGFEGMQGVIHGLRLGTLGQCWNSCREALKSHW